MYKSTLLRRSYSATTRRAINIDMLRSILIPDPQNEKLQARSSKLDRLIKLIHQINIETEQLIKLREYIMPYMLFGIVR